MIPTINELSREEALQLLATAPIGRLGVSIRALPAVLPVNFAVVRERVIIRTVAGSKLDAAVDQTIVAFEADRYSDRGEWGWSVLIQGPASEITDPDELLMVQVLPLRSWAFDNGVATRFICVEPVFISGRRFGAVPAPAIAGR